MSTQRARQLRKNMTETEAMVQAVANALDAPPATPDGVATSPASGEEDKVPE